MKLRERIEENVVVWLLGTLLSGFLAGLAAYKGVLEIAGLETVSSAKNPEKLSEEIEQLKAANAELSSKAEECAKSDNAELALGYTGQKLDSYQLHGDRAKQLVVRIAGPTTEGAGIIVANSNEKVYIVTARHVVFRQGRLVKNVSVDFRQSETRFPLQDEVKVDKNQDLATFSINLGAHQNLYASVNEALSMHEMRMIEGAAPGEFLYVLGHSTTGGWQLTLPGDFRFYAKERNDSFFITGGFCPQGYSGGAVFDKSWRLLGMMLEEERPVCRVLPMREVKNFFVRQWGFEPGFKK